MPSLGHLIVTHLFQLHALDDGQPRSRLSLVSEPNAPPASPSLLSMTAAMALVERRSSLPNSLRSAADELSVVDPSVLERASLQRRFDHKYLLPLSEAASLITQISGDYGVVLAGSARFAKYDTVYFDTPQLTCYHDHRRRRRPRSKIRVRHYVDRDLSVLEVKRKTARGDTDKQRWVRRAVSFELTEKDRSLVYSAVPRIFGSGATEGADTTLLAQARTVFSRLTLVNKHSIERATLDFELLLQYQQKCRDVGFVVVEVKDSGHGAPSPLVLALRAARARLRSFSKYSIAVAALGDERTTTLRPMVALLERGGP